MNTLMNEVVVVVTNMGEVVGRLKAEDDSVVIISDPRLFIQQGDQAGFAPGVSAAGEQNPKELRFNKSMIITICVARQEIADGWRQQTSGIIA